MGRVQARRGRIRTTVATAALATLAVSGCATGNGLPDSAATQGAPATQPPADAEGLSRFYEQELSWEDCGPGGQDGEAQCTWLEVPVDYDAPEGETIELRALRVAASGTSEGALLVNPGGPGGSAVEYARAADWIVTPQIRESFDVVGLDPRGVGESAPIECVGPEQMDAIMELDPTPDDETEMERSRRAARDFGAACEREHPELLPHVSTVEAARDMDVLRAALGEEELTYLGKSYGTFLGATYAGLFPERSGRLVLDGAIAPELSNEELNLGQAGGFETATRAYVADCVEQGACPLGSSLEEGMTSLKDFLAELDENPVPVTDDARVTELGEGWAGTGLARAMYDESSWPALTDAIRAAQNDDGNQLMQLAREYADRDAQGEYFGNIMQVISAVNCLDRPAEQPTEEELAARVERFEEVAPTWGASMALATMQCEEWPVRPDTQPEQISAEGSGPIVVIGTTRDPATPYEWAEMLAGQLEDGRLVTFDGDGHTAYMRGNECVDQAVDTYLTGGEAPEDGLTC